MPLTRKSAGCKDAASQGNVKSTTNSAGGVATTLPNVRVGLGHGHLDLALAAGIVDP